MLLNVDTKSYSDKPTDNNEIGGIVNRLKNKNRVSDLSIEDICIVITEGRAITGGVLHGKTANDWKQQQLFLIDVDNKLDELPRYTPKEAENLLNDNGIPVCFAYYTYSHTPKIQKFRLVMACEEVIYEPSEAVNITKGILSLFPTIDVIRFGKPKKESQVDLSCYNLDRQYFGTNKGLVSGIGDLNARFSKHVALSLYTPEQAANDNQMADNVVPFTRERKNKPGDIDLALEYSNFDLAGYLRQTESFTSVNQHGKDVRFNPCPICRHNDCFDVNTVRNLYICRSDAHSSGGNIINYLMERHGIERPKAREKFKYELLGLERPERKKAPDAEIQARIKEFSGGKVEELTESGHATRLYRTYGRNVKYVTEMDDFYLWSAKKWEKQASTVNVIKYARRLPDILRREGAEFNDDEIKLRYEAEALTVQRRAKIDAIISLMRSEPGIGVKITDFNNRPELINCQNGTYDINSGKFTEHKREDMQSSIAAVNYDPKAECPNWIATLEKFVPDAEKRAFLQRYFGYCATGYNKEKYYVILYGIGNNGKSTIAFAVQDLLGEYGKTADGYLFFEDRNHKAPMDGIAFVYDARMVVASEGSDGATLNTNLISQITSGGIDPLKAEFKHKPSFEFQPVMKLILLTNHKPRIKETTNAIWNRTLLVPFDVTISAAEADRNMPEKLKAEYSGILNWVIAGAREWAKSGLRPPASILAATNEYRNTEDNVSTFMSEACETDTENTLQASTFYKAYEDWCLNNGMGQPVTMTRFFLRMKDQYNLEKIPMIGRNFYRIKLKYTEGNT